MPLKSSITRVRFDDSCAGTQQIVKYLHLPLEATNAEFTMWCGCDDTNRTMGIGNTVMSVPACSGTIQAQGDEKPREFKLEAFTGHVQSYMNKVREAVNALYEGELSGNHVFLNYNYYLGGYCNVQKHKVYGQMNIKFGKTTSGDQLLHYVDLPTEYTSRFTPLWRIPFQQYVIPEGYYSSLSYMNKIYEWLQRFINYIAPLDTSVSATKNNTNMQIDFSGGNEINAVDFWVSNDRDQLFGMWFINGANKFTKFCRHKYWKRYDTDIYLFNFTTKPDITFVTASGTTLTYNPLSSSYSFGHSYEDIVKELMKILDRAHVYQGFDGITIMNQDEPFLISGNFFEQINNILAGFGLSIKYYYNDEEVSPTARVTRVVIPYLYGKEYHGIDHVFDYPVNLTNGFNLINVYTNLVQSNVNTSDYLSSFVITNASGTNVSNPGIPSNFSNSNKPIDRYLTKSQINELQYKFEREDGENFTFNGEIIVTLECETENNL